MTSVANQDVPDGGVANGSAMPSGNSPGATKGRRETFLGSGSQPNMFNQVSAGTPGPENNKGGIGLPMSTAPSIGPGFVGGPTPDTLVEKSMKTGNSPGTSIGVRKTFL